MDFAKRQLEKYGWKKGNGLGKKEDGITEALKPKLKFDNTGVGFDQAAEYKDHWWIKLYDRTAKNVDNKVNKLEAEVSNKDEDTKLEFGRFVKTGKLTATGMEHYKKQFNPEPVKTIHIPTDEELFEACGRRYLHQGTRFGLMKGKISRMEKDYEKSSVMSSSREVKKLKKKHKSKDPVVPEDIVPNSKNEVENGEEVFDLCEKETKVKCTENSLFHDSSEHKTKKNKKGTKKTSKIAFSDDETIVMETLSQLNEAEVNEVYKSDDLKGKKLKKSKKRKISAINNETDVLTDEEYKNKNHEYCKPSDSCLSNNTSEINLGGISSVENIIDSHTKKSKKKHRRHLQLTDSLYEDATVQVTDMKLKDCELSVKKLKKSKKLV